MPNPLKIKEPDLLKFHNSIVDCFIENDIAFEADYEFEADPEHCSTVNYIITSDGRKRGGFISAPDGKFAGAIIKDETIRYLGKEGFSEDQIGDEPVFASAPCVMAFVCMLAINRIKDLTFPPDLIKEFDQLTTK